MAFAKEVRRLPEWLEGAGPTVNLALMVVVLGPALAWSLGYDYLDPMVLTGVALGCIVFPAALGGPAGLEAAPDGLETRVAAIAAGGFCYGLLVLAGGLAMVNWQFWHGVMLLPGTIHLTTLPLLPAGVSAFVAGESARLVRKGHKPGEIGARFRWTVLIAVLAWYFRAMWMPAVMLDELDLLLTSKVIAAVTVVVSAGLAAAGIVQARRLKMIRWEGYGTS